MPEDTRLIERWLPIAALKDILLIPCQCWIQLLAEGVSP